MARTLRKPTLSHSFALLFQLQYAPKRGEGGNSEYGRGNQILNKDRQCTEYYACNKECPPTLCAEVVLRLDDNRMKESDNQEGCKTDYDACEVHCAIDYFCEANQRSASSAAIQPEPAATIA